MIRSTDLRRLVAAFALLAAAGVAAADSDPRQILSESQAALKALKAVRYDVDADAQGPLAIRFPKISGTVRMARDAGGGAPGFRADMHVTPRSDKPPYRIEVASNGKSVTSADHGEKTFTEAALPEGVRLLGPASLVLINEYTIDAPFARELKSAGLTASASESVGGVECHVVSADFGAEGKVRWYISKKDRIPLGVDRIRPSPAGETTQALRVRGVELNPTLSNGVFVLTKSEDFADAGSRRTKENAAALDGKSASLEWTLKDAEGKDVSLKGLRGRVVLLDFWATWCGPCKMAMPGVERIHKKFKDKPVSVYGVVTWERPGGDPAGFMKKSNYTYPLLFKGDDLARQYGFYGIPAFVLIGPDGTILHKSSGYSPAAEKQLESAIETALAALEKGKP